MNITRIVLKNYRNYAGLDIDMTPCLNIVTGGNAQGKTNLLESVYLAGVGRSARTPRDRELIRWGETACEVKIEVEKKSGKETVEIFISDKDKKRILINGIPILRMGELMGTVNVIYFSPDEMKLIKEGPSERRRFMDIDISQLSKNYFYSLMRYNNVLAQRNKLLKSLDKGNTLEIWDGQLAKEGARLIKSRRGFIERLKPFSKAAHQYLTDGKEILEIDYLGVDGTTLEEITENLFNLLVKDRNVDIERGFTNHGPHKDDVRFVIESDSGKIDIRSYGSQGQQRTAALSLKLAELEIFAEMLGEYPILLLDDVMSELDEKRRELLLKKVGSLQTIITATELETDLPSARFTVKNGEVSK